MKKLIKLLSRIRIKFRRSSSQTKTVVISTVALSLVALLTLHLTINATRKRAEELRSEAAQLEGFPLPPRCLQGLCSASQRSGTFSRFPSSCVAAPEDIRVVPCVEGGEWDFVSCVFGDKRGVHGNLLLLCFGSK